MRLIRASFEILHITPDPLVLIERAGRVCYKSECAITDDSAKRFVENLIKRGHESVLEHASMTVRFICDRGVSHELVRHRLASFSQESTRYCNYKSGMTFVIPPWVDITPGEYGPTTDAPDCLKAREWLYVMSTAEWSYQNLIESGRTPQQARAVAPNSLKTEVVMTANFREWRHVFKLRTEQAAHPQMRELMVPLLDEARRRVPVVFDDIG